MTRTTKQEREERQQPLRIYYLKDGVQATTTLCPTHRETFYLYHPDAVGCGEYGGTCVTCSGQPVSDR